MCLIVVSGGGLLQGCSRFGQTTFDNRIYSLSVFCTDRYPDEPPVVRFLTRVNMTCVNQADGTVRGLRVNVFVVCLFVFPANLGLLCASRVATVLSIFG
jgi:hypothetical protein